MSWDIFVQDLPEGIRCVAEIPDDFVPREVIAKRSDVIRVLSEVAPQADLNDPEWILISGPGCSIELSLANKEALNGFAFFVRGSNEAAAVVADILRPLGLQALDMSSETGLFDFEHAAKSLARWRLYRNQVIDDHGGHPPITESDSE
ncbi:MAG TPA: hypothetical protein VM533_06370 [Fimbriiglobus sp.]|jgi:hypothetical protein|nr:hypothetical protein [Fimbriiglobus sp.]